VVHNLGLAYQVDLRTWLEGEEHCPEHPLNQTPDDLRIEVMSSHLCMHIDCKTLALVNTAPVLVEGGAVADGGDNAPFHLM
jgi:hypothetical protein